jgi:hypothetical protein
MNLNPDRTKVKDIHDGCPELIYVNDNKMWLRMSSQSDPELTLESFANIVIPSY